MFKHFLCLVAIFIFLSTIQSDTHSDNDTYNEYERLEIRFYNNDYATWKIKQRGSDTEDNQRLITGASIKAAQTDWTHALSAYASFQSQYTYTEIKGSWYLRAKLDHDWATDESPYEKKGKIRGIQGGMSKSGNQSDVDYWAEHDPHITKKDCDAYSEAKVYHPSKGKTFRSVAYAHFTPIKIEYRNERRP